MVLVGVLLEGGEGRGAQELSGEVLPERRDAPHLLITSTRPGHVQVTSALDRPSMFITSSRPGSRPRFIDHQILSRPG